MNNYFSFSGRIRRLHYGLRVLLASLASVIIVIIWVFSTSINPDTGQNDISTFGALFVCLTCFVTIWFALATNAKRCHDLNKNGWWQLIPFYGFVLLFAEGTHGPNNYGDDPKSIPVSNIIMTNPQKDSTKTISKGQDWDIIRKEMEDDFFGKTQASSTESHKVNNSSQIPNPAPDPPTTNTESYKKGSLYD